MFSFVVPVINYGFIGEGETKPRRTGKKFAKGGRDCFRLIIVRRHCSAALLNWQKEISCGRHHGSCIGKPMMSKGIRSLIETSKHIKKQRGRSKLEKFYSEISTGINNNGCAVVRYDYYAAMDPQMCSSI